MLVLWEFHWTRERQIDLEHGMYSEESFKKYKKETLARDPGGVLPYIRYIGMCRPKGYGF